MSRVTLDDDVRESAEWLGLITAALVKALEIDDRDERLELAKAFSHFSASELRKFIEAGGDG